MRWWEIEEAERARAIADAASRLGDRAEHNKALTQYSSYRVGGPARLFVRCHTEDDLAFVSDVVQMSGVPAVVLGFGTNQLIADRGFDGLAIALGRRFVGVKLIDDDVPTVRAGGRARLVTVARNTAKVGWHGMEWSVGIPASVGGAVCMNAGAHHAEMADSVRAVTVLDLDTGSIETWSNSQCGFRRRGSAIAPNHVVLHAELELTHGDPTACLAELDEHERYRKENHPGGRNTGSVFETRDAWRHITEAGCADWSRGAASVSDIHANFIVVDATSGPASAQDVFDLMVAIRTEVAARTGVDLRTETRLLGFTEDEEQLLPAPDLEA